MPRNTTTILHQEKTEASWHKNLKDKLATIDNETKELFRIIILMVIEDATFELLKTLQEQEAAVNINGNDVIKNPVDLHMHFTYWVDKYSKLPKTADLLLKYGTDGWLRALLRAAGGVNLSSTAARPPETGVKNLGSTSPPPSRPENGGSTTEDSTSP